MKRITLIVGHYGSGKTEFAMNLTMDLKKKYDKVAILDMDIANPYFRSRERQKYLEEHGVTIHHNAFGYDIAEDLPAISATLRAPLENKDFMTVVDVGGNDSGARVLNQFKKYFMDDDSEMLAVVNANRFETDTVEGCISHILQIHEETGIPVKGIINNTHMLRETTVDDIIKGYKICKQVGEQLEVPLVWNTCRVDLLDELETVKAKEGYDDLTIYPIQLYMRPTWLDQKID